MIVKIVNVGSKWKIKKKTCIPFYWKTYTKAVRTAVGYRRLPRWFETHQDAITWIQENSFIEILVFREKHARLKERLFLIPSSQKEDNQTI